MVEAEQRVVTLPEMTPAWVQAQLTAAGYPVQIDDVSWTPIGTGQIGRCYRGEITYRDGATGPVPNRAPASVVAKLPSDDPTSRATGVALRNYLKEVRFYQEFAEGLTIRVPACYHAAIVDEGPDFSLLLEDLQPAQPGNQLEGCSVDVARAAIQELVGLHAPSWNDQSLAQNQWLFHREDLAGLDPGALYNANLDGFLDRYGPALAPDQQQIIRRYGELLGTTPRTASGVEALVHIDYRLDNLLIDSRSTPPVVTVVDWQSIALGSPLGDVAYFLGAGLMPEDRRPVEEAIVRDYYAALCAAGITDYDWDACWADYRLGTFAGFGVTVIASMIVERTERGDAMFTAMAQRHARHALDHAADTLF